MLIVSRFEMTLREMIEEARELASNETEHFDRSDDALKSSLGRDFGETPGGHRSRSESVVSVIENTDGFLRPHTRDDSKEKQG